MNLLFCRNLHIAPLYRSNKQTLINFNSVFEYMMIHKSSLEKWITHQTEETYNLSRFLKEPNEHGKSPEKLLYERSLKKGNYHTWRSIQRNLIKEDFYHHTYFIEWSLRESNSLFNKFHSYLEVLSEFHLIIGYWKNQIVCICLSHLLTTQSDQFSLYNIIIVLDFG